jgi:hypothetical protein
MTEAGVSRKRGLLEEEAGLELPGDWGHEMVLIHEGVWLVEDLG